MASYYITYTSTSVTFVVTGLFAGDSVRLFLRNEPANGPMIVDGGTTYTATGSTFQFTIDGLSPNTDYAANVEAAGIGLGAQYFTTLPARPEDWEWYSNIASGEPVALSALEWNDFCERINSFRAYKDLHDYNFSTVYSGTVISADIVNQARSAISDIPDHGYLPGLAVSGSAMNAAFFHALRDALNAI